jgi:hypothetical protein
MEWEDQYGFEGADVEQVSHETSYKHQYDQSTLITLTKTPAAFSNFS